MHYECANCRCMMQYDKETSKGKRYKCPNCGNTGYMEGMEEADNGAGIDPSDFGL